MEEKQLVSNKDKTENKPDLDDSARKDDRPDTNVRLNILNSGRENNLMKGFAKKGLAQLGDRLLANEKMVSL